MTTIIIDGKNKEIYADTMGTIYGKEEQPLIQRLLGKTDNETDNRVVHTSVAGKAWANYHHSVAITGSGSYDTVTDFFAQYPNIQKPKNSSPVTICVCRDKGSGLQVTTYRIVEKGIFFKSFDWEYETTILQDRCMTLGSGGDYAFGAIKAGKSPREAIQIASLCDPATNGDITVTPIPRIQYTQE